MRVQIFDVVAVCDSDEEGVIDEDRVDLHIDVEFDESAVLLIRVGDEMHSGDVPEGSLVIGIDLVNFKPVLEQFTVHQLAIITYIDTPLIYLSLVAIYQNPGYSSNVTIE